MSVSQAAYEVGIAQPSLSRQIAALEKDLGVRLFDRGVGAVTLCAAGEVLLPVALRMLEDRAAAYRQIGELAGLTRGRLRLGATPSLCISLVADVLSRYRAAHPGVDLHVTEAGSRTLTSKIEQGELDVALVVAEPGTIGSGLDLTTLLQEELVVVSSAALPPPTDGGTITLEELSAQEFVACHDSYDLRSSLDQTLAVAGLRSNTVVQGAELDAVLRFVARGIGVSVAPRMAALHYPGLRITYLEGVTLTRTVSIARRANLAPSPAFVVDRVTRAASPRASRWCSWRARGHRRGIDRTTRSWRRPLRTTPRGSWRRPRSAAGRSLPPPDP
ncbi:DNA-binding transcriptional LysR family regulator [Rhodococcus sp. OK519]|nr:DNA-binding transcriptional LysR family regulator [Rhodococcus sp. OK519]